MLSSFYRPLPSIRRAYFYHAAPSTYALFDHCGLSGAGVGEGVKGMMSSVGELLERRAAFIELQPTSRGKLKNVCGEALLNSLMSAIAQTSDHKSTDVVEEHDFNLVTCRNLFSFDEQQLPYNLVGVNFLHENSDLTFLPFNDTCGHGLHRTADLALQSAVNEYIERQYLTLSWLYMRDCGYLPLSQLMNCGVSSKCKRLINLLNDVGDVEIWLLNDLADGFVVFAAFTNDDLSEHNVHFAVGASCSADFLHAVEKGVSELWLTFIVLAGELDPINTSRPNNETDGYTLNLLKNNSSQMLGEFGFSRTPVANLEALSQCSYSFEEQKEEIKKISSHVFFHLFQEPILGLYFAAIASPDFFLHMNTASSLNIHNKFSSIKGGSVRRQRTTMIPFP